MKPETRTGLAEEMAAIGIFARQVKEIHAGEDDEKSAEERDCVYRVGRVEASK